MDNNYNDFLFTIIDDNEADKNKHVYRVKFDNGASLDLEFNNDYVKEAVRLRLLRETNLLDNIKQDIQAIRGH